MVAEDVVEKGGSLEAEKEFNAAFDEGAGIAAQEPATEEEAPKEEPKSEPQDAAPPPAASTTEPESKPQKTLEDLLAEQARLNADLASKLDLALGEIEKLKKGAPPSSESVKTTQSEPPPAEEDPEVAEFMEQYDYLAKPLKKIIERELRARSGERPLTREEVRDIVLDARHFDAITEAHEDFYELRDSGKLEEYAKQNPDEWKIFQSGTAKQVIGLISRYKQSLQNTASKAQTRDAKLKDLEVVRSSKTPIDAGSKAGFGADDYESAFDEAASKVR